MIIDVFPFFNETELVELRCELLRGVVDLHVAVAATHTYQGNKIPTPRFALWDTMPTGNLFVNSIDASGEFASAWEREKYQRQMIREVVAGHASDDDIIIYTDADEIPNPEAINKSWFPTPRRHGDGPWPHKSDILCLDMRTFYYGTQLEDPNPTDRGKLGFWRDMKNLDWNELRWKSKRYGDDLYILPDAGWHISYYGGPDRIKTKLQSFSHVEYSNDRHIRRIQSGVSTRLGPNNERLVAVEQATLPDLLRGL